MNFFHQTKKKGFVLLYAVLVSSVILAVGASLINIVTKQIVLSTVGRDSQFAYYAADAGAKCASYWNASPVNVFGLIEDGFITEPSSDDFLDSGLEVFCNDRYTTVDFEHTNSEDTSSEASFFINFERSCAKVGVFKEVIDGNDNIMIISNGYNKNDCGPSSIDTDRTIERTVIIRF